MAITVELTRYRVNPAWPSVIGRGDVGDVARTTHVVVGTGPP